MCLQVYPSVAVNGNSALLMVPASLLPASAAAGHSGVVFVDGYGVAAPGTSTEGLTIEVPVAITAVSSNSGTSFRGAEHCAGVPDISCVLAASCIFPGFSLPHTEQQGAQEEWKGAYGTRKAVTSCSLAGSMAGGQNLDVSGSGFSNETLHGVATSVSICGVPCAIQSVQSAASLTCTTGEYSALDTVTENHRVLPILPGQASGTGSSWEQTYRNVDNLFDEDVSTEWRSALRLAAVFCVPWSVHVCSVALR